MASNVAMAKLFNVSYVQDIFSSDFPQGADAASTEVKNAIAAAEAKGDGKAKVAALLRMADYHIKKRDTDKIDEYLDEAGKLARRISFDEGKAYMLIMQAKLELWHGAAEEAVTWSRDALKIFKKLGDERAIAFASNMHAFVLAAAGKPQEGMQCAREALIIYKKLEEAVSEVGVLRLLMDMFMNAGDNLRAGLVGWEIVKVVGLSGGEKKHKLKLSEVIQQIASIEFQGNDMDKAMKAAEEARELFQKDGDINGEAIVMKTMMNVYIKKGKFYDGVGMAKAIVQLYKDSSNDAQLLGGAQMDLAQVYLQGDSADEAIDAATQALTSFSLCKDDAGMKQATEMLKDLSSQQRKQNIKLVLEMNKSRLGHIPKNLIIAPDGLDIDAFNGFKK
jgi:tetratricopeptide (TPR) repeat protein